MLDSKATPSAMPVQPRTCRANRPAPGEARRAHAQPHLRADQPAYKFMSHTLGLTHKLVINGGCSAPSTGQANCQLSHSNPGIDFHSILHASEGGGVALPPEPIVHSLTTQDWGVDVLLPSR